MGLEAFSSYVACMALGSKLAAYHTCLRFCFLFLSFGIPLSRSRWLGIVCLCRTIFQSESGKGDLPGHLGALHACAQIQVRRQTVIKVEGIKADEDSTSEYVGQFDNCETIDEIQLCYFQGHQVDLDAQPDSSPFVSASCLEGELLLIVLDTSCTAEDSQCKTDSVITVVSHARTRLQPSQNDFA